MSWAKRNMYRRFSYENPAREAEEEVLVLDNSSEQHRIVLYNDDFNTFDFVIESLINICGHSPEQAEQCTFLVHYKGKCTVKTGGYELLKPMHEKLISRSLTAELL